MTKSELKRMTDSELKERLATLERKAKIAEIQRKAKTGETSKSGATSFLNIMREHEEREIRAAKSAKTYQERQLHERNAARARAGRKIVESWDKRGREVSQSGHEREFG